MSTETCHFESFLRPHILDMQPYTPILPFEVLSEQLNIPIEQIIKLDANENPYGPLPGVTQVLAAMPNAHIYPDPESRILRRIIASHYGVPFQNVMAGAGADELIDLVMRAVLDPGDAIINLPPTFGMYSFDAAVNHAKVISLPRSPKFEIDIDGILEMVADRHPKVLFLANPNNPDGSVVSHQDLVNLLDLPILVVVDEAYVDFAQPGTSVLNNPVFTGKKRTNLVVLRTFSKWAGLAGLRVGFGIFPDWMMPHLWKIKQPYNVSVAASTAAAYCLENHEPLDRNVLKIVSERERVFKILTEFPWLDPYPSQANFILCKVLGGNAFQLKTSLANQGILVRYFNKPGLTDHIRISIGRPEHNDHLIETLQKING